MKLNIVIGGKAGQGINAVSCIVSRVLAKQGYFTFNYRDYGSLIRGGHNFNILTVSDKRVGSNESKMDGIIALDERTIKEHKKKLKEEGFILDANSFDSKEVKELGINLNLALAGALIKILGVDKKFLLEEVKKEFGNSEAEAGAEKGYQSQKEKFKLKKLKNKIILMSGSEGVAQGAMNSEIELYLAYPMTPATGVMHELAKKQLEEVKELSQKPGQKKRKLVVFQPESEIAVVNAGLGASYAGAKTMIGTSGGGFDLMSEGLSLQGQSAVPLVVYLSSRPGPGTGVPTYTSQADLNIALRAGHGEFPRAVIAPGDPMESVEKTNEAFYLAEKFKCLAVVLNDKHLAESEYSTDREPNKQLRVEAKRDLPGMKNKIVKASSYECDKKGNTIEEAELTAKNAEERLSRYRAMKKECQRFEMIKIYGKKNSKNLVIGWGSTKTSVLDAIKGEDYKFLQVLYLKPMSDQIEKEIKKAEKVILVEQNSTGQLGRVIKEKTGLEIKKRVLKYDGRPFNSDELKKEILKQ